MSMSSVRFGHVLHGLLALLWMTEMGTAEKGELADPRSHRDCGQGETGAPDSVRE